MLDIASSFAREMALEFSTEPVPARSKGKAIYKIGANICLEKPAPLVLRGQDLPRVANATHLRQKFHKDGTMTMDTWMRRGSFISGCLEVQEVFAIRATR